MRAICEAIEQRRLLTFTYHGFARVVEPHAHGSDSTRRACLSGYQVAGGSSSGEPQGWKFFRVASMRDVAALADGFAGPRAEYRRDDPRFGSVHCQL